MRKRPFSLAIATLILTAFSSGCLTTKRFSRPVPAPHPQDVAYHEEEYQLIWTGLDLERIESLDVAFPNVVQILPNPSEQLIVHIKAHIQDENHEQLFNDYIAQAVSASDLQNGSHPKVVMPTPTGRCRHIKDGDRLIDVKNICLMGMTVFLPASKLIKLNVKNWDTEVWVEDADATNLTIHTSRENVLSSDAIVVQRLGGNLAILGDGVASFSVHDIRPVANARGNLTINLDTLRYGFASRIRGWVKADVDNAGTFMLDGNEINQYPYQRPPVYVTRSEVRALPGWLSRGMLEAANTP